MKMLLLGASLIFSSILASSSAQQQMTTPCSNHVLCAANPCDVAPNCIAYPSATCVANYCGGCNAHFYLGGQLVNCNCAVNLCAMPPCDVSTCPKYPHATCMVDPCGGCNAWFLMNGMKVNDCHPTTNAAQHPTTCVLLPILAAFLSFLLCQK